MSAFAHSYYFVLLGYLAVYAVVYLVPLVRASWALKPGESLKRLLATLRQEVAEVEAEVTRLAAAPVAAPSLPVSGAADDAGLDDADGYDARPGGDGVAGTGNAGGKPARPRRFSTERLHRLGTLTRTYDSPLVQEAVDQIRVQYPGGAYQQVQLDRLPSFLAYTERVGAARTMAGLFVLLGLLLTMIRLDVAVDQIGDAAQAVSTQEGFLASMGAIMGEIGGAFASSIWGLGLMLAALFVIAVLDRAVQARFNDAEQALAGEVVPALAQIHTAMMPDLTLGDLLAETGTHLDTLNHTVSGLTEGMASSLSGLGAHIEDMLSDFRSFQEQYVRLNDLLKYIKEASENLGKTTAGLEGASRRLAQPLDEFNRNLLAHLETVADAVAVNREGYEKTSEQMTAVQGHIDAVLMAVENQVTVKLEETTRLQEAALEAVMRQAEQTNAQLMRVAQGLEQSANVQIEQATDRLAQAADRMARRHAETDVPPSFFSWLVLLVRRIRRDGVRSLGPKRS